MDAVKAEVLNSKAAESESTSPRLKISKRKSEEQRRLQLSEEPGSENPTLQLLLSVIADGTATKRKRILQILQVQH